jgi:dienelactone hydrolase
MTPLLIGALLVSVPLVAPAAVVEEVIEVPVRVRTISGKEVSQSIKVTVFREEQRQKAPYLVLNHGRPPREADFAKMGRQRFAVNSRYFVSLGFVVLVPTRVGYGESGGPDVEYSGTCSGKNYAPGYAAAADQAVAVLNFARALPYVDLTRGIVVGQSFGGMTTIALSARELPGLAGAVNFAGGGGGNPLERPEHPCVPFLLEKLFREYGAAARVPTLWLYSENDRFFGARLPKEWFDAFVEAGGKGRFVQLPPFQDNGHRSFEGNPAAWKPAFEAFLHEIGF